MFAFGHGWFGNRRGRTTYKKLALQRFPKIQQYFKITFEGNSA